MGRGSAIYFGCAAGRQRWTDKRAAGWLLECRDRVRDRRLDLQRVEEKSKEKAR